MSQGPGLGTVREGERWASTARPVRSPEAAGMVQASQRPPGTARGGPRDQLPSSSTASPPPRPASGVRAERVGPDGEIEGEQCSPRFPFSLERGTHSLEQFPKYGPDKEVPCTTAILASPTLDHLFGSHR